MPNSKKPSPANYRNATAAAAELPGSPGRRRLLATGGAALVSSVIASVWPVAARGADRPVLRWGIVGTGTIAAAMADVINSVPSAELAAVSSRRLASAREFAALHGAGASFDDWAEMFAADEVDAVYVATPTGVREEISVAAAAAGKHVLAEKPFASVASLTRIVEACRAHDVGFMDGNHFGHHPRTAAIREAMPDTIGWPWSLVSTFQFSLPDRGNIRYDPALEPMGAVGDVGWYCMRAIVEYLSPDLMIDNLTTFIRRDAPTGTAIAGSGVIRFSDGATSTWNCGYDTNATFTNLRLTGREGAITLDDFPANNPDGSADYRLWRGDFDNTEAQTIRVPSPYTSRQLMFEDFAAMTTNAELRERSISDSLRTQALLDAVWESGLENES